MDRGPASALRLSPRWNLASLETACPYCEVGLSASTHDGLLNKLALHAMYEHRVQVFFGGPKPWTTLSAERERVRRLARKSVGAAA